MHWLVFHLEGQESKPNRFQGQGNNSHILQQHIAFDSTYILIKRNDVSKFTSACPQDVVEKNFVHLSYTDAVELLLGSKKKFEFPVMHEWQLLRINFSCLSQQYLSDLLSCNLSFIYKCNEDSSINFWKWPNAWNVDICLHGSESDSFLQFVYMLTEQNRVVLICMKSPVFFLLVLSHIPIFIFWA